jgi:quinoprotein glucose dehydrogenase
MGNARGIEGRSRASDPCSLRALGAALVVLSLSLGCDREGAGPIDGGTGSGSRAGITGAADLGPEAGWPHYGGDRGGMRHSPAVQITRENVADLEVAWVHHSGDLSDGSDGTSRTSFNVTPLLVGDQLVYCTPMNRIVAVDAETGSERWAYDPVQRQTKLPDPHSRLCRGVAYWSAGDEAERQRVCGERIFMGTIDAELVAVDARTGKACGEFGREGRVDLRAGMGEIEDWAY